MAKTCTICGKGSIMGRQYKKLMSKYNPTPMKRKYPNLQWLKKKGGGRVLACAKCIKKAGKEK